jgi:hypothetical protein
MSLTHLDSFRLIALKIHVHRSSKWKQQMLQIAYELCMIHLDSAYVLFPESIKLLQ